MSLAGKEIHAVVDARCRITSPEVGDDIESRPSLDAVTKPGRAVAQILGPQLRDGGTRASPPPSLHICGHARRPPQVAAPRRGWRVGSGGGALGLGSSIIARAGATREEVFMDEPTFHWWQF
jgi:hypothetical protein